MPTAQFENRLSQLSTSALEPLGAGRRQHLAGVVAGFVPDWSVELHYDEYGKAAIVIMPEDMDDTIGPTLIVSTTGPDFDLDELRCDVYHNLGQHLSWSDILRAVRVKLAWEGSTPATLH
jgi:hypothetical protein